ncbi:MAG: PadR family transcriptional regulator [Nitrososphaerota archaeon]|jgi:DNA-binding PadR family transcriptional regulator|nr:PadR family transcriptional regulator [Nitrososphaerota archaeon]
MVSAPRGLLRLVALQLLSESSLSGAELQEQVRRSSAGVWKPGPGSIYFMIKGLRDDALIVELPGGAGTTRRYVISNKGRAELEKLKAAAEKETRKQLQLLAYFSELAGDARMSSRLKELSSGI